MYEQLEGLGPSPEPIYLFVDLGKTPEGDVHPWHMWDAASTKAIPVFQQSLTGRLVSIRLQIKEFQQKQNYKIDFKILSGTRTWILRSGTETIFSRGVLLGLQKVPNFRDFFIKIHAKPGDTTVYGNVYDINNNRFEAEWDTDVKLLPIIQELQRKLEQDPQTPASIKADFEAKKNGGSSGNTDTPLRRAS